MTRRTHRRRWLAGTLLALLLPLAWVAVDRPWERDAPQEPLPVQIAAPGAPASMGTPPTLAGPAQHRATSLPGSTAGPTIEVEVVSAQGLPVEGAEVQAASLARFRAAAARAQQVWDERAGVSGAKTGAGGRAAVPVRAEWGLLAVRATFGERATAPRLGAGPGEVVRLVLPDHPELLVEVSSAEEGPVADALVVGVGQASSGHPVRLEARTGPDGTCRLLVPGLRFGRLSLAVSAPRHADAYELAPPGATRVSISLRPAPDVSLTLLDAARQPVSGAVYWRIEVPEEGSGVRTWSRHPARQTAAPQGVAVLSGVPPEARLLVCAVGSEGRCACALIDPARSQELVLSASAQVAGRAVDERGAAVAGLRVELVPAAGSGVLPALFAAALGDLPFLAAESDGLGAFALPAVPSAPEGLVYGLRVVALDQRGACRVSDLVAPTEVSTAPGRLSEVELRVRMQGPTRISGVVRDADGRPVAGAQIALGYTDLEVRAVSGPDGAYAFEECGLGSFQLHCRAEGFVEHMSAEQHRLPSGQIVHDIELAAGGSLSGTLLDSGGSPAQGVILVAVGPDAARRATATTGRDGTFRLPGLAPGRYRVTGMLAGAGGMPPAWDLSVPQGAPATLRLPARQPTGSVQVKVQGASPATLGAGAVHLYPTVPARPSHAPTSRSDATFVFEGVPLGAYLAVWHDGGEGGAESRLGLVEVASAPRTAAFSLPPAGVVAGRVSSAAGQPLGGLSVSVHEAGSGLAFLLRRQLRTEADGSFSLSLGEGDYDVRAHGSDVATSTARIRVAPGSAPQRLLLTAEPSGSLQVVLRGYGTAPLAAVSVVLTGPSLIRWSAPCLRKDGALALAVPGIPAGGYRMTIAVDGEPVADAGVTVAAGAPARFEQEAPR